MGKKRTDRQDLLPGTLDMLILKSLTRGVMHGYGIAEHIRQLSDEVLHVEEGSLYPALQRLQIQGWIASEWGHSVNNRRARYYRLDAGRAHAARRGRDRASRRLIAGDHAGDEAGDVSASSHRPTREEGGKAYDPLDTPTARADAPPPPRPRAARGAGRSTSSRGRGDWRLTRACRSTKPGAAPRCRSATSPGSAKNRASSGASPASSRRSRTSATARGSCGARRSSPPPPCCTLALTIGVDRPPSSRSSTPSSFGRSPTATPNRIMAVTIESEGRSIGRMDVPTAAIAVRVGTRAFESVAALRLDRRQSHRRPSARAGHRGPSSAPRSSTSWASHPLLGRASPPTRSGPGSPPSSCSATRSGSARSARRPISAIASSGSTMWRYRVIGVMPAGFRFPGRAEYWRPWAPRGVGARRGVLHRLRRPPAVRASRPLQRATSC